MRFFTDTGIEVPAVTAEQMRELDRLAMEETGPNLFQMMENAGRGLAGLAIELFGQGWLEAKIVVLAGGGGNGGGGICAARHLANRGAHVRVCLSDPSRLGQVPAFQRKIFHSTRGQEVDPARLSDEPVDLILDALIGYGLNRAPSGVAEDLIRWANGSGAPILSLDIPSGVDATTGHTRGEFVRPRWTMTLALPKTGLTPGNTGKLFLADVGLPEGAYRRLGVAYRAPFGSGFYVPLACG